MESSNKAVRKVQYTKPELALMKLQRQLLKRKTHKLARKMALLAKIKALQRRIEIEKNETIGRNKATEQSS